MWGYRKLSRKEMKKEKKVGNIKVGDKVEFLTDGGFGGWQQEHMDKLTHKDCYGIKQPDGHYFIYSKRNNKQLTLSGIMSTTWCFYDDEVNIIERKPSFFHRLYTAIIGALLGPESHSRNRY